MVQAEMPLSDTAVDSLHHLAIGYYDQGKYEKSSGLYRFLTMLRPENDDFWFGLGSSLMLVANYDEAMHCFQMAEAYTKEPKKAIKLQEDCNQRKTGYAYGR